jgi:uncharacterized membrane protein
MPYGLDVTFGILLIVVLIPFLFLVVGVLVVRSNGEVGPPSTNALDSLRERYARGEITQEQFDEARKALGG